MDSTKQNQEFVKKLFTKSNDLKLSSNVSFIVGSEDDKKEFKAMDIVILISSNKVQVIEEPSENENIQIEIPEIDSTIFVKLIRFIHLNETIFDLSDLNLTYRFAQAYSIKRVCKNLIEYCDKNLTIDNAIIIYDQFIQLKEFVPEEKLDEVLKIINVHAFLVFQSKEFFNIHKETLIKLLNDGELFIKETDLYLSCLCWISAELKRNGLKENLKNRKKLFKEFKKLIRFPLFSHDQFFNEVSCSPAKSGLFDKNELNKFKKYFETKSIHDLSGNYNTDKRDELNIGKLMINKRKIGFNMAISDLFDEDDKLITDFIYSGSNFDALEEMDDQTRRSSSIKLSTRKSKRNKKDDKNIESIRMFRIKSNCNSKYLEHGYHPQIRDEDENLKFSFRRYLIDNECYFDFYPYIELKKDHKYIFEFFTHDGHYNTSTIHLKNVYSRTENNERQIDVKMKLSHSDWGYPQEIFFLYE